MMNHGVAKILAEKDKRASANALRDQLAMAALTGIISSPMANRSVMVDGRKVAMAAYEFADFMLSARSQEGKS